MGFDLFYLCIRGESPEMCMEVSMGRVFHAQLSWLHNLLVDSIACAGRVLVCFPCMQVCSDFLWVHVFTRLSPSSRRHAERPDTRDLSSGSDHADWDCRVACKVARYGVVVVPQPSSPDVILCGPIIISHRGPS
jgi:hypothetical protein